MSGGYFNGDHHRVKEIADNIVEIIRDNDIEKNDYKTDFSDATLDKLNKAIQVLNRAYIYSQRIDYLMSGDDSEESFHKRLGEDLSGLIN